MANDIADKLDEARKLIEAGWCQDANALGKSRRVVDVMGNAAVCFCAGGAIRRASGGHDLFARSYLRNIVGDSIEDWNDAPERTQAEVIAAFRKAADLARAEQSA